MDRARERSVWRAALEADLPEEGAGAEAVVRLLRDVVVEHGLRMGPGFCGWIATAPDAVPLLASVAALIAAPQRWWVHPGNFLEGQAVAWLRALLGLGQGGGSFTSGGAMANLTALTAARQHAGERRGLDVAADGVAALPEMRVYAGAETCHHVVERAVSVLGMGRRALVRVPAGRRETIDVGALAAAIDADAAAGRTPVAVVATAGDASAGRVDPVGPMQEVARERGVWLHVDGAYGAFAVLDPRVRARFGDLAAADSIAVDPHKWLAVPAGCGAVLVRDAAVLERALALSPAPYLEITRRGDGDPGSAFDELGEGRPDQTLEHSAPARGVAVWAALAELGAAGMRARVARHLDCARLVAERATADPELELLVEPVLSIVCLRYRPPGMRASGDLERVTRAVVQVVRARGRAVPSTTRIDNKLAIRACFLGPRTTLADADALVDEILAAGRAVSAR
ncbi:MAG TPA: pyridoxal-dependent decarboxylase [Kofleriaceae bacterium]|nr:pyridoxal-dependent decarboxylase [Kofleriaceae bacterium]